MAVDYVIQPHDRPAFERLSNRLRRLRTLKGESLDDVDVEWALAEFRSDMGNEEAERFLAVYNAGVEPEMRITDRDLRAAT